MALLAQAQRRLGQRRPVGVDGGAADDALFQLEPDAGVLADRLEDADRLAGDLDADAVARQIRESRKARHPRREGADSQADSARGVALGRTRRLIAFR